MKANEALRKVTEMGKVSEDGVHFYKDDEVVILQDVSFLVFRERGGEWLILVPAYAGVSTAEGYLRLSEINLKHEPALHEEFGDLLHDALEKIAIKHGLTPEVICATGRKNCTYPTS
jgi:hypothetical protein